jgi:hypothetical protein
MPNRKLNSAYEPSDLRWTLVPMTLALVALVLVLVLPGGESPPPATVLQGPPVATQAVPPAFETVENDHATGY